MISLNKLYSIDTLFGELLSKKAWLKDGGYLYIESTEALTVVDVNTGKNGGGDVGRIRREGQHAHHQAKADETESWG